MADQMKKIDDKLQAISLDVVTLEDGDVPSMGIIINSLTELEDLFNKVKQEICLDLTQALKGYMERMVMEEVVIKSIGQLMKSVKGIAGGAILGDGRVGLILDISGIFEMTEGSKTKPTDTEEEASQ